MDSIAAISRSFFNAVIPLYRDTNFAYTLASLMGLAAIVVIIFALVAHAFLRRSLIERAALIRQSRSFVSSGDAGAEATASEMQFFRDFDQIDEKLGSNAPFSISAARAWLRFRDSVIVGNAAPLRATRSPREFYFAAVQPPAWLEFAAGMFIAFGLLATFLGLVAALSFAAEGLQSNDTAAMQAALRDLLAAASSKFVTSVAGVGLSMLLRATDHLLSEDLRTRLEDLCVAIETGVRVETDSNVLLAEEIRRLTARLEVAGPAATPARV